MCITTVCKPGCEQITQFFLEGEGPTLSSEHLLELNTLEIHEIWRMQ